MNYCKQIDKYISQYLDELLDDNVKSEFLIHIDECSQCSDKLKEASIVADLCRENEDIQLPENFSSSLHERLVEVSGNKGENEIWTFVHNKRFIASLSTAAVLVVSLLAYGSLPHMGSLESTSMANDSLQVETSSAANSETRSSENKSKILSKDTADSISSNGNMSNNASSNNTDSTSSKEAGIQTERKPAAKKPDVTVTFNKSVLTEEESNSQLASKYQDKIVTSSSNEKPEVKQDIDASCYTIKSKNQGDTDKYFSNYAELNLKVSSAGIEIEDLRKIMKEFDAIELKPVTLNSSVENSTQDSIDDSTVNAKVSVESPQYVDYYLSLSAYTALENVATEQFKLLLSMKTGIIKTDISDKYNDLNTQIIEIDRQLAVDHKMDLSGDELQTKRGEITKEMDKIASEKEMITVRIFYTP